MIFMKKLLLLPFLFILTTAYAQSPTDLNTDIGQASSHWFNNVNNITAVITTYNNARRAEEIQLSLPVNSLGNLTLLPNWSSLSDDEKVFHLVNAERTCRLGVDYGLGGVLGLPFEGIEMSLDAAAQAHADDQVANNTFSHTGSSGSTPFTRIDAAVGAACTSFMSYGENLAAFFSLGGTNSLVMEHAVYNWIYEDNSSSWGHRRALLIQDTDIYGATGFTNDYGSAASEGFIGIGVASAANYDPFSFGGVTDGDIVAFSVFDPIASGNCTYMDLLTGLEINQEEALSISMYPNPAINQFIIEGLPTNASVQVINSIGVEVLSRKAFGDALTIDVSNLAIGVYFVRVTGEAIHTFKLLKN
jgi:uncharacterized protein YkwD